MLIDCPMFPPVLDVISPFSSTISSQMHLYQRSPIKQDHLQSPRKLYVCLPQQVQVPLRIDTWTQTHPIEYSLPSNTDPPEQFPIPKMLEPITIPVAASGITSQPIPVRKSDPSFVEYEPIIDDMIRHFSTPD